MQTSNFLTLFSCLHQNIISLMILFWVIGYFVLLIFQRFGGSGFICYFYLILRKPIVAPSFWKLVVLVYIQCKLEGMFYSEVVGAGVLYMSISSYCVKSSLNTYNFVCLFFCALVSTFPTVILDLLFPLSFLLSINTLSWRKVHSGFSTASNSQT